METLTARFKLRIIRRQRHSSKKKIVIHSVEALCNNYDLVDSWREQHPHEMQFTWRNSSGKIKRRLDFWLISKRLLSRVTKTDICAYYDLDHSPVTISIKPEDIQEKRGPGYWKLNNSLLEDEEFVTKMSFVIKHAAEKHKDIADKKALLGNVKNGDTDIHNSFR